MCVHNVEQIAVCNLASIALNRYVTADRKFDFKQLEYVTSVVVKNLNKIIDVNYYPVPEVTMPVSHLLSPWDVISKFVTNQNLSLASIFPTFWTWYFRFRRLNYESNSCLIKAIIFSQHLGLFSCSFVSQATNFANINGSVNCVKSSCVNFILPRFFYCPPYTIFLLCILLSTGIPFMLTLVNCFYNTYQAL